MEENEVSDAELKAAFQAPKPAKSKKLGLAVFLMGIVVLASGVAFLLVNLLKGPSVRDAEYLVQIGAWQREDEPTVIWNFTEIGHGALTTNFYINEYDFRWRIDGDVLKVETDWLYTLDDEYAYKLDQGKNVLTLSSNSGDVNFVPASSIDAEIAEDN